jgi:hypothetical protein
VRWVRDTTGRFPRRPHYDAAELDQACEDLIGSCVRTRRPNEPAYPLTADDLAVLIEQRAADLDLYADLSTEGPDVEAVTDFVPGQRPRVRISHRLSEDRRRRPRLRTTLAHELAHVVLHDFIWWFDSPPDSARAAVLSPRCHQGVASSGVDWMEWQAGYASGAMLMPASALRERFASPPHAAAPWVRSPAARPRIRAVQDDFDVSAEAARVRLLQLGLLAQRPVAVVRSPLPSYVHPRRKH